MSSALIDLGSGTTGPQGPEGPAGTQDTFLTIVPTAGDSVVAATPNTSLAVTSSDNNLVVTGDNTAKSLDMTLAPTVSIDHLQATTIVETARVSISTAAADDSALSVYSNVGGGIIFDVNTGGGVSMAGPLDIGGGFIHNVATPVSSADAATKGYVDGKIAAPIADIADPSVATPEDCANKINALLASLRAAGLLAT